MGCVAYATGKPSIFICGNVTRTERIGVFYKPPFKIIVTVLFQDVFPSQKKIIITNKIHLAEMSPLVYVDNIYPVL